MIEKAKLKRVIKKSSKGDFSSFMSKENRKDVVRVLKYAAKKANTDQKKLYLHSKFQVQQDDPSLNLKLKDWLEKMFPGYKKL